MSYNQAQQEEIDQWITACAKVIGEDNVVALIEHGYFLAVEDFDKPPATYLADYSDLGLYGALESKPELSGEGYIRLVVNNG